MAKGKETGGKEKMKRLAAYVLAVALSSAAAFAQSGPRVTFNYVQTSILNYPGSPMRDLPFTPYLAIFMATDQPGDGFLIDVSFTDARGIKQDCGPQFVKRSAIDPSLNWRLPDGSLVLGVGFSNVAVGEGISNVSIQAWNVTISGPVGIGVQSH